MYYEGRVHKIFLNEIRGLRKIKTDSETFDLNNLQRVVTHRDRKGGGGSRVLVAIMKIGCLVLSMSSRLSNIQEEWSNRWFYIDFWDRKGLSMLEASLPVICVQIIIKSIRLDV